MDEDPEVPESLPQVLLQPWCALPAEVPGQNPLLLCTVASGTQLSRGKQGVIFHALSFESQIPGDVV